MGRCFFHCLACYFSFQEAIDLNMLKLYGKTTGELLPLATNIFRQENREIGHQQKIERALRLLLGILFLVKF